MTALSPNVVDDLRQENERLQAELRAARDRQAGSAEVLRAIAGTSGDAERSLQQIAEITERLFGASSVTLLIADGEHWGRTLRVGAGSERIAAAIPLAHIAITPQFMPGAVYLENRQFHVADVDDPAAMARWPGLAPARKAGTRIMSGTPLRREGRAIGSLIVHRDRLEPFTADELALQQSFADQAGIAIENARLFNESQQALARQTATSEILRVISGSPTDVQPVFDAIVLTAARLLRCDRAFIQRCEGGTFWTVASAGQEGPRPITQSAKAPVDPEANFPSRAIVAKKTLHLPDWSAIELPEFERRIRELHGINSALYMPLLREGDCIGLLAMAGREANLFGESEIALAESFRDQALIAIENTRLFNETKEALERQTATADILKVIASSPSDVQPVFNAIASSANALLGGLSTAVHILTDDTLHLMAFTPTNPAGDANLQAAYPRPLSALPWGAQLREGEIVLVGDTEVEWAALPGFRDVARMRGFRSILRVPLLRDGATIGAINVTRTEPGQFARHHVQLLQTFADQAVIAIENVRLFNETKEALERQTATADILKVIASSPSDVQPVFDAIAASSKRLIGGFSTAVFRFVDGAVHLAAYTPSSPAADAVLKAGFPRPIAELNFFDLTKGGAIVQQIEDTDASSNVRIRDTARVRGFRSMLFSPLISNGTPIGIISVTRAQPGSFAAHHVQLLQTFADQAVIAIENVRLFNETKEALERQTATADILKVIASSPSDVQPVFEAIATSANRLIGGFSSTVFRFIDGVAHLKAFTPTTPAADEILQATFPRPVADFPPFEMAQAGEVTQIPDTETLSDEILDIARARGFRSMLFTPLMNDGVSIGFIVVTRVQPGAFADHHVQLLRTFADQAVIAIENVRLFDEVQAKTRDLTEALTYQTGSGNILKVIASSPTDVGPVLEAIVESACELCEADDAIVQLRDGDDLVFAAHRGTIPVGLLRRTINRNFISGRANVDKVPVHVRDVLSAESDEFPEAREMSLRLGTRSFLAAPLLREGESIGTILLRRTEVKPFSEKQIALLQTFADQAVIAIGNVRLFDEVQARTRDLTESLQQQIATADVLKVISRSAFDLQAVLDALVQSAAQLSDAAYCFIFRRDADKYQLASSHGFSPEYREWMRQQVIEPGRHTLVGKTALEGRTIHLPDVLADPDYTWGESIRRGGFRTMLGIPLLREGVPIGVIAACRPIALPFTEKQIGLITTFADQAVIAIENVRLFDEVQARTKELAASLDELRTAQDRLVQTEKLASLGQLTAGIAHEIKNPLNFVNNFSALSAELTDELNDLLKSAVLTDKLREEVEELTGMLKDNLQKVVQHGKRADSIVKNMLLHSREGSGEHRPADINAILDESLNLAYHGARAEKREFNVTLQRDFDEMAGTIEVFPQEITRVFLNLISNGFYAVTKRKTENGGSVFEPTIRATTRSLGDTVEVRIRDNGTGIPAEVREKMFNPFFTTKPAGEGTGLGLSMSHDIIVKQHGGRIDVETEPGEFTEFRIVLPRTKNPSDKNRGQT